MLFIYKTAAMQSLQFAAKHHHYWASIGIVKADKLTQFHQRIVKKYKLNRSRAAFSNDKKKSIAVVKFILYPCSKYVEPDGFYWFLLSTIPLDGEHQVDIRQQPLLFANDYQLIRQTKKEVSHPVWTWKLTKTKKQSWKGLFTQSIKFKDSKRFINQFTSLAAAPHFHGIRLDRYDLLKFSKGLWGRTFRKSDAFPFVPKNRFKRIVKVKTITQLQRFVNEMNKHERCSEDQLRIYKRNLKRREKQAKRQSTGVINHGNT